MSSKSTSMQALNNQRLVQYDSQGLAISDVVLAGPGDLFEVIASNNSSSTRYLQFFDLAAVPADTAVPVMCPIVIPAASTIRFAFGDPNVLDALPASLHFATGICWASSSTMATKTASGVADLLVTARYA